MTESALYDGTVIHQRLQPIRHRLRYAIFMLLLDLDELAQLASTLRLFSHNRFNIFSFRDTDHGSGVGELRPWIEARLADAGLAVTGGAIRVLCMPRVLGFAFNPISVFFCYSPDGRLAAMLYEVNNTFGERHAYLIPVRGEDDPVRQTCEKQFYVSPFMPMELTYRFRVHRPGPRMSLAIDAVGATGKMITTGFYATRAELSDRALLRSFLRMPLPGLKVVAGIHWEAMKLFLRGLRLKPRPAPPDQPVSITL